MSFRLKTILGIAAIELAVILILIAVNQWNFGGSAGAQLQDRARSTGDLFANMVADAVISNDLATLDAMVANTLENDDLVYIRVVNSDGIVLSEGGMSKALQAQFVEDPDFDAALSDHTFDIRTPVELSGLTFGSIEIGLSTQKVEAAVATSLRWNVIVAVIGMAFVALFGYLLGSVLTRQLGSLRKGARMISSGDLGYQIEVKGHDELAETAHCFNSMARTLAKGRDKLVSKQCELVEKRTRTLSMVDAMVQIAGGKIGLPVPDCERDDEIGDMARATAIFQKTMREVQRSRAEQAQLISAFDQLDEQVAIFANDGRSIFLNTAFRKANQDVIHTLPKGFSYKEYLAEGLHTGSFPGATGREEAWLEERLGPTDCAGSEVLFAPDRTILLRRTIVDGIGEILTGSDITELKTSQAQLLQTSKLATLGEMATGIAHELNQPLGVIRMAANNCLKRIQKGQVDPDYLIAKLERMCSQTDRAAQIINHMRIFGRSDDGRRLSFSLVESLTSVEHLMRRQLEVDGIALDISIEGHDFSADGHQVMFEQVLLNLINNARDAVIAQHPSGDLNSRVEVKMQSTDEGRAKIRVRDTGGGIPEAIIERLFDPFFTTKAPGKGTGLGLSISYGIVRDMGGQLSVTNTDIGAEFEVLLPVQEIAPIAKSA